MVVFLGDVRGCGDDTGNSKDFIATHDYLHIHGVGMTSINCSGICTNDDTFSESRLGEYL
jgi:hypothetical protein